MTHSTPTKRTMKTVTQLVDELKPGQTFFSLEFFPPKTEAGTQNLTVRLERMAKLGPLFVTITWGAGGSTSTKSLNIASMCAQDLNLATCLHLTCTNMDQTILDDALDKASEAGIKNILALRGDPPRGAEYAWTPTDSQFEHAIDLVKYIKKRHGNEFCIGVAAYPEGHVDGVDTTDQDPAKDIPYLKGKIQAGADFIITQLFYDVEKFMHFEELLMQDDPELFGKIPLIPGLMPVNTYQSFVRAAKLSKASIPADILHQIQQIPTHDDDQVKEYGVKVLNEIISQLRSRSKLVKGFHLYTLNLEKCVARVLERAEMVDQEWSPPPGHDENENRLEPETIKRDEPAAAINISTGRGELGREATWDDFPNGRFGNSKSPAYGEIDGYGPTLHVDNAQALELWGHPANAGDISKLFSKHITNELEVIPWSDQKLSAETALIQEELLGLIERGMWTVASQPATGSSAKSTDKIFGWGPPGGQVFQKAFVEFFISNDDWQVLKPKLDGNDNVSYYEGDAKGGFTTDLQPNSSNVVTWGVFPNREVVQSTIVEEESFKAWRDESFSIWLEFMRLYQPGSDTAKLLKHVHDTYHLVSVVHHDYFNDMELWHILGV